MPTLQEQMDFVIGPQSIGNTYFDETLLAKARLHGEAFPATPPPADQMDAYTLANYYDLARSEYVAYGRTGDPAFLSLGRKVADSWWLSPYIKSGALRQFDVEGTSPKFAGVAGLILRALDGRPEMWDWIDAYSRHSLDLWIHRRMNTLRDAPDPSGDAQIREAAFSLHFAVWLSQLLPDSFPLTAGGVATNGAQIRAQYLADVGNASVNYFAKLQFPDGSWRWDDWYFTDEDGGQLRGITQPFMVGLLLRALCDVHAITPNSTVKESIKTQILNACRHLYSGGPYTRTFATNFGVEARGFHYFYHGGTTVNPTKYVQGDLPSPWPTTERWHVESCRQAISTVAGPFAYAYKISGDEFFKTAGNQMVDSAYGGSDGFRAMMADTPKNFNQHVYGTSNYLAWVGGVIEPSPTPTPTPTPPPAPTRKVGWPTGEAKQNAVLDEQWKERYRMKRHLRGASAEFEKAD